MIDKEAVSVHARRKTGGSSWRGRKGIGGGCGRETHLSRLVPGRDDEQESRADRGLEDTLKSSDDHELRELEEPTVSGQRGHPRGLEHRPPSDETYVVTGRHTSDDDTPDEHVGSELIGERQR